MKILYILIYVTDSLIIMIHYCCWISISSLVNNCYQNSLYKLICDIYRVNNIIYTSTSSGVNKFYYSNSIIYQLI